MKPYLKFVIAVLMATVIHCRYVSAQHKPGTSSLGLYAPSAASLMTFTDYPVSYMTGQPDISIPLYTIHSGSLELPVAIKFHMADFLRVNQMASPLGAGWSITTDLMVTRKVKGLDDFLGNGYYLTGADIPETDVDAKGSDARIHGIVHEFVDSEPDQFYFNTLNGNGRFYIVPGGSSVQVPTGPEKIQTVTGLPPQSSARFVITDGEGAIHTYSNDNIAADKAATTYTAWHCTKITDDTHTDVIDFHYRERTRIEYPSSNAITVYDDYTYGNGNIGAVAEDSHGPVLETGLHDYPYLLQGPVQGPFAWAPDTYRAMRHGPESSSVQEHVIERLDFRGGYMMFSYETKYEYPGYVNPYIILTEINVYADGDATPVKTIEFEHNTNFGNGCDVYLTGLTIDGTMHYSISYGTLESRKGTPDFWGYAKYDHAGLPHVSADSINVAAFNAFILDPVSNQEHLPPLRQLSARIDKKGTPLYLASAGADIDVTIGYPTGGRTVFSFERDRFIGSDHDTHIISSRRLSAIKHYDTDGTILKHLSYNYVNGTAFHEPVSDQSGGFVNTVSTQTLKYMSSSDTTATGIVFDVSRGTIRKRIFHSGSLFNDEFSSNWVRYPEVHEIVKSGNAPVGKTVYTYDLDGRLSGSPGIVTRVHDSQQNPIEKDYWYCGLPVAEKIYSFNPETGYSLSEQTEYTYHCHLESDAIKEGRLWAYTCFSR